MDAELAAEDSEADALLSLVEAASADAAAAAASCPAVVLLADACWADVIAASALVTALNDAVFAVSS